MRVPLSDWKEALGADMFQSCSRCLLRSQASLTLCLRRRRHRRRRFVRIESCGVDIRLRCRYVFLAVRLLESSLLSYCLSSLTYAEPLVVASCS